MIFIYIFYLEHTLISSFCSLINIKKAPFLNLTLRFKKGAFYVVSNSAFIFSATAWVRR